MALMSYQAVEEVSVTTSREFWDPDQFGCVNRTLRHTGISMEKSFAVLPGFMAKALGSGRNQ